MSDGLVMVCDVDLAVPDATRVHTVEVARNFAAEGLAVDLVARGPGSRSSRASATCRVRAPTASGSIARGHA